MNAYIKISYSKRHIEITHPQHTLLALNMLILSFLQLSEAALEVSLMSALI